MKYLSKIIAVLLVLFGLLTIFMGGSVIFDLFGVRAEEGNYVLFVVWANWICGFIYLIAAYGFFYLKRWTSVLMWFATGLLIVTFLGFFIHIETGGIYETKTIFAMTFRTTLTLIIAIASYFLISKKVNPNDLVTEAK